jgi:DivIVA domain-containing protein
MTTETAGCRGGSCAREAALVGRAACSSPGIPPSSAPVRDPLPEDIRDPSFPAAVRGYDRRAVDTYVERVNGLIAELQVGGSPQAAVRHALDRVGEQTSGILQPCERPPRRSRQALAKRPRTRPRAPRREAQDITTGAQNHARDAISRAKNEADELLADANTEADEILARVNDQSDSMLARARVEAEERARQVEQEIASLREDAEARMRSLQADIAAISDERRTLLDNIRLQRGDGHALPVDGVEAADGVAHHQEALREVPHPPTGLLTFAWNRYAAGPSTGSAAPTASWKSGKRNDRATAPNPSCPS